MLQVHTFIADSAPRAVADIRQQLGPEAVVLNVRQLPAEGLRRLWRKPRIEVLACLPEEPPVVAVVSDPLIELRQEVALIRQRMEARGTDAAGWSELPDQESLLSIPLAGSSGQRHPGGSQVGALLEASGLLPRHVQRVLEELQMHGAEQPPASLAQELDLARAVLVSLWRPATRGAATTHVFVGSPAAGKTTVLCKWLAQAVLVDGARARVLRLDGQRANTAESLSLYAEILGVPVERVVSDCSQSGSPELVFVDLPGVNWADPAALDHLRGLLATLADAEVHLVLNAAYEWPLLLAQARAFSALPVSDVIITHLDEDPRWGKLWNIVLGTNYSVAFLSSGQNVPGHFEPACVEKILARHFQRK